jgi:hypothetical protein
MSGALHRALAFKPPLIFRARPTNLALRVVRSQAPVEAMSVHREVIPALHSYENDTVTIHPRHCNNSLAAVQCCLYSAYEEFPPNSVMDFALSMKQDWPLMFGTYMLANAWQLMTLRDSCLQVARCADTVEDIDQLSTLSRWAVESSDAALTSRVSVFLAHQLRESESASLAHIMQTVPMRILSASFMHLENDRLVATLQSISQVTPPTYVDYVFSQLLAPHVELIRTFSGDTQADFEKLMGSRAWDALIGASSEKTDRPTAEEDDWDPLTTTL